MATLERKKVVVVGDGATGKTCLLIRFAEDKFEEEYIPTIFENRAKKIAVDGREIELTLWDTAGQEAFEVIRPLAYKDAEHIFVVSRIQREKATRKFLICDIVLICYSTDSPESLRNVSEMWVDEIKHYCPKTPILLIATKSDLKNEKTAVSLADGKKACESIQAREIIECSSLLNENVQQVFNRAATIALEQRPKNKGACCRCTLL